jgi:methyl coenzyme M reductase subunit C
MIDAEDLVELGVGERPVRCRDRSKHVGVEIDLVQGNAVGNTKVQLPGNRAHLRR